MIILTDGEYHDSVDTIDLICQLSQYPVSLIIIGVGDSEHFGDMENLDGDKQALKSKHGPAVRDIVQFVKFRDYVDKSTGSCNMTQLSEEVLRELPGQIVDYMMLKNIAPTVVTQQVPMSQIGHA
jgi:hypothetical protein